MPNHITNQIVFKQISEEQKDTLCEFIIRGVDVDFSLLVPAPLNLWNGSFGDSHEKAFGKRIQMEWQIENWGTKWNAYDTRPIEWVDNTLSITFDTAWRPPYPWLAAVLNKFRLSFKHHWIDEGNITEGKTGVFTADDPGCRSNTWEEEICSKKIQKILEKL